MTPEQQAWDQLDQLQKELLEVTERVGTLAREQVRRDKIVAWAEVKAARIALRAARAAGIHVEQARETYELAKQRARTVERTADRVVARTISEAREQLKQRVAEARAEAHWLAQLNQL